MNLKNNKEICIEKYDLKNNISPPDLLIVLNIRKSVKNEVVVGNCLICKAKNWKGVSCTKIIRTGISEEDYKHDMSMFWISKDV